MSVDISAALAAPGVVDVLTYADIKAYGAKPMPLMAPIKSKDGSSTKTSPKEILASDRVTFIGEAIALVVAETYAQAKDAAELVAVEYEPLDATGTLAGAPSGPQIWESAPGNLSFDWEDGDEAGVKEAFAKAAHTVKLEVVQNRISYADGDAHAIGVYDPPPTMARST